TETYTLSLHDALPICWRPMWPQSSGKRDPMSIARSRMDLPHASAEWRYALNFCFSELCGLSGPDPHQSVSREGEWQSKSRSSKRSEEHTSELQSRSDL